MSPFLSMIIAGCLLLAVLYVSKRIGFFHITKESPTTVPFSFVLMGFIIYLGISFIVSPYIYHLLLPILKKADSDLQKPLATTIIYASNFILNTLLIFLFSIRLNKNKWLQIWHLKPSVFEHIRVGFFSFFIGFFIFLFVKLLMDWLTQSFFHISQLPEQEVINYFKLSMKHPLMLIVSILLTFVYAPLIEEIIFRGFLQNWLKNYLSRTLAVIITSFVFAGFHFSFNQGVANIPIIGSLFALSCFIGFVYEKQRSLIAPIILHATFNFFGIIQVIFEGV